jgi:mannose-6-phosphate isomerase-like protein (cupin superfamily)
MTEPGAPLPDRVRLPLTFDVDALLPALGRLEESDWEPHFNTQQYEGDWSGVALRTAVGSPLALYPDPGRDEFADTPLLAASPEWQAALARVASPLQTVRLLRLGPGATITSHRDHHLAHQHGEVRLHVPLVSGAEVTFWLDEVEVPMRAGECWYLDLTRMHRVTNSGTSPRVHLVIDCRVDEWLTGQIVEGAQTSRDRRDAIT